MKRVIAIVISAVAVAAAGVYLDHAFGTATAGAAHSATHAKVASGSTSRSSVSATPSSNVVGGYVLLEQPPAGTQPAVSESAARQAAATEMPSAFGPGGGSVTDQLALFTDLDKKHVDINDPNLKGPLVYDKVLAWVVTASGLCEDALVPLPSPRAPSSSVTTEWNVVIDATTGALIEDFSYR